MCIRDSSYTMHQMIPDILIGNLDFMEGLSEEERAIFDEGFQILNQTQRDAWETAVEEAKEKAENEQGVNFSYPDITPFQEAVAPMPVSYTHLRPFTPSL